MVRSWRLGGVEKLQATLSPIVDTNSDVVSRDTVEPEPLTLARDGQPRYQADEEVKEWDTWSLMHTARLRVEVLCGPRGADHMTSPTP